MAQPLDPKSLVRADARLAEKLRAREDGRAPVFTSEPTLPTGLSATAIDARFRAKLTVHGKKAGKPEAKPDPGKPDPKAGKPEAKPDPGKPDPKAGKPEAKPAR